MYKEGELSGEFDEIRHHPERGEMPYGYSTGAF